MDYRITKIKKSRALIQKEGGRGGHTTDVWDILPYLPNALCFFDCRHFVCGENIVPFAISTRTHANNQQYLKIVREYEDNDANK